MIMLGRTRRGGKRIEDHDGLVPPEFHAPWTMIPSGPFRIQVWHESDPMLARVQHCDEFAFALGAVCAHLPPRVGLYAFVIDESFRVVFGYACSSAVIVEMGAPVWYGVRAAFEVLEQVEQFDRMDLAVWESCAKDRAT